MILTTRMWQRLTTSKYSRICRCTSFGGATFFATFDYDLRIWGSFSKLKVGSKFTEGRQAEIFHAKVTWNDLGTNKYDLRLRIEYILKIF